MNNINNIIDRETVIWKEAYPESKELLDKFSKKIKLDMKLENENKM